MGQDVLLPRDLVSIKLGALQADRWNELCWGVTVCPHLLLPSQAQAHSSDNGPTQGLQGDIYAHESHNMHTLMDTPNSERCMQP